MRHSVLRCVWLAAVAVAATGATACQSDGGPPHVAPGTPVGKVVDVAGQVTATRDGKTRPLAAGEDVSPDDLIATTDAGSVSIELFHNRANLQLQNGATSRIDDSLAWELTKSDVAKLPGGKVMVSAGRHGERTAAESSNDVSTKRGLAAPSIEAAPPSEEPNSPPQPVTGGAIDQVAAPRIAPPPTNEKQTTANGEVAEKPPRNKVGGASPGPDRRTGQAPPTTQPSQGPKPPDTEEGKDTPPPPPPRDKGSTRGTETPQAPDPQQVPQEPPQGNGSTDDDGTASGAPGRGRKSDEGKQVLDTRVEAVRAKLKGCLTGKLKHLTISITVSAGKLTFGFLETGVEGARSCVEGVLKQVDLKNADGRVSIEITL